jgi:hypothetical protein
MEASAIYSMTVESIAKIQIIPLLILPVIIGILFTAGYFVAGGIESKRHSHGEAL